MSYMFEVPIAHFSGKFHFQMPGYNNDPRNLGLPFDPSTSKDKVMQTCECDPAGYFEFRIDGRIASVTYRDGTNTADPAKDPVVGKSVIVTGFLVDISPSAICAVLHAGQLTIDGIIDGAVPLAFQSDLRLCVRPEGFGDETAAAHYLVRVPVASHTDGLSSRFADELGAVNEIELHFHLNRYTRLDNLNAPEGVRLTGDVYGYFRRSDTTGLDVTRKSNRRLVAHPQLSTSQEIERLFLMDTGGTPMMRITDIDGYYDLNSQMRMLCLRYLHFIPFLDRNYATPSSTGVVREYLVYFTGTSEVMIGRFAGHHEEMLLSGGLLVFKLPPDDVDFDAMRLSIDAVTADGARHPLMIETEWDIELLSDRGLTLGSNEGAFIEAMVYFQNRPHAGTSVTLETQPQNRRSPIVASVNNGVVLSDAAGRVRVEVKALDLRSAGGIFDPVTQMPLQECPWDRNYGNYVYLHVDNPLRRTNPPRETIEVAVRVLHKIEAAQLPAPVSYTRHVKPLFAYHLRYFPWLHVRHDENTYIRFLDLADFDSFADHAQAVLARLELPDSDPRKMPRSRDLPFGSIDIIRRWIAEGMAQDVS